MLFRLKKGIEKAKILREVKKTLDYLVDNQAFLHFRKREKAVLIKVPFHALIFPSNFGLVFRCWRRLNNRFMGCSGRNLIHNKPTLIRFNEIEIIREQ